MVKSILCPAARTTRDKTWPYEEYYLGDKDVERRKSGQGTQYWSGAKSQEWYTGRFLRDTMHGTGDYRWRYYGTHAIAQTYEGYFYANHMHGYGTMSYADGSVFRGLFHSNCRWGPGVLTHITRQEDVGLWQGSQLIRLAWRPQTMSIVPDLLAVTGGTGFVETHRVLLGSHVQIIGETNSALDLLKHYGMKPVAASMRWQELYPRYCTDVNSALFYKTAFDQAYYRGKICMLKECTEAGSRAARETISDSTEDPKTYFAWNNSNAVIDFMKHCYTHEIQRKKMGFDLVSIMSGHRKRFKAPGKHELECRTVLMACYLGDIPVVTRLINQCGVHPNVSDMQGNTALMYAVCGDQVDLIKFLLDAGADVNSFNDACCTPLGIALMRLAATKRDISILGTVTAMIPPQVAAPAKISVETLASEWNILRNQLAIGAAPPPNRTQSKVGGKTTSMRKIKSITSVTTEKSRLRIEPDYDIDEMTDEKQLFINISNEFESQVNNILAEVGITPIPYIFETNDMTKEIDVYEEEVKKSTAAAPKKNVSKVLKDTKKSSKILLDKPDKDDVGSMTSAEIRKQERLDRIMLTILHLLSNGSDPKLVKCPQPALPLAIAAGNADLVKYLIQNGADANQNYYQMLGYSPLEIAVSRPLTQESLELIRTLLENGAIANRRLPYYDVTATDLSLQALYFIISSEKYWCWRLRTLLLPGPNLLHVVIARKTEGFHEEEIRNAVIDLLLEFGCDANALFKGRSPIEMAMTKSIELLDVFIKNKKTDLNGVINEANQSILVKMFTLPFCSTIEEALRLQILTNLLLYGADPFIECQNGEEKFPNVLCYAKKVLDDLENNVKPFASGGKSDTKGKKPDVKDKKAEPKKTEERKKDEKLGGKSIGKIGVDVTGDFRQALDLVTECGRLLRVRWIQGRLVKELVGIVDKYKHRAWHLIIKEHANQKKAQLWLTPERCVEIWDILKTTKKKVYQNRRVLKMVLYIVQCYSMKLNAKLSFKDKELIESEVEDILNERRITSEVTDTAPWLRPCVQPELMVNCDKKFKVCFECGLPIAQESLQCISCELVSFCNLDCMRSNVERLNSHPCNEVLKRKYFPTPAGSLTFMNDVV